MKIQDTDGSSSLHVVEGRLAQCRFLGLPDSIDSSQSAAPELRRRTFLGWLKAWAPIFAALSGNGGVVTSAAWRDAYQSDVLARLNREADKVKNPSTWSYANLRELQTHASGDAVTITGKNGKIIGGKLPVEVEIEGSTYRGFLGGQCFEEGDCVAAVIDGHNRLMALSSPDRTSIVMDCTCHDTGFAALVHDLWVAWKIMTLILCAVAVPAYALVMAIEFGFSHPLAWLAALVGAPIGMGTLVALILVFRLSLLDFWPALRTSSIFRTLGRPDLTKVEFDTGREKAEQDGKIRPSTIGLVFYSQAPIGAWVQKDD